MIAKLLLLYAPLAALFLLFPTAAGAADSVVLSEFMAVNATGLLDEDGAASDWIELRNPGTNPVNLAGWRLTDDPDDFSKWIFPATNLPASGFLVVFASGKNRTNAGARLHTSFSLDADGEYLALIRPDGLTVASEFAPQFPSQYTDVSYGLNRTNAALQHFFATPTPGALNSTNYFAKVADTKFKPDRGFYETNFSVTITCATPGVTIRFTLNGTAPSLTNGFTYAAPLAVTNTTTLRAAAFKTGFASSDVDTHSYLFLRDVVNQSPTGAAPPGWPASWGGNAVNYGMDPNIVTNAPWRDTLTNDLRSIPTLSVVMKLDDLFNATTGIYANPDQDGPLWERAMSVELLRPDGDGDREFQINGGVRIRGGFSRSSANPKHSFRFFFRPEFGDGSLDFPFFGSNAPASFKKFDLRSHQDDSWHFTGGSGEFMRDAFSRDSLLACGRVQTHGQYHHLYLNGQYWGLFTTEERPEANFAADYFGGDAASYDVVRVEAGPYDTVVTDGLIDSFFRLWQAATNGFATDATYQKVQGNNPDGTPNAGLENLLDVPGLIDYMLCIFYAGNLDAPASTYVGNNNWFGARHRDNLHGGFRFFLHDSENSLYGVNDDRTGGTTSGDPFQGSGFLKSNPEYFFSQLRANAEFRVLVSDHVQRHFFNGGALTLTSVTNRYFARRNEISRAVVAESARWGDAQREPPFTRDDWLDASDNLVNNYFPFRSGIVLNQLRSRGLYPDIAAPLFSQYGGSVPAGYQLVLTNPTTNGVLYFTTDGRDPRQRGGAIAPTAQAYSAPVSINTGTLVRARVKDGASWSALVEATLFPTTDYTRLALTEIMFNPPVAGLVGGDEFEFLEFQNSGGTSIDLSGLAFANGITFVFTNGTVLAPGQFFLLARNPAQFAVKYPGVTVNGVYSGRLDNGGELLRITNPFGGSVLGFTYGDLAPWPVAPDGFGFSLVNIAPELYAAPDEPLRWRASANPGGSPGAADPSPAVAPVLLNELHTHTDLPAVDFIELFNPATNAVSIGGWFLTDDPAVPKKFRIADGTMILPGGFAVFTETNFNATPGTNNSFSLSSEGEQVYLFSGNAATNLTGYSHGVVFGAAANGVSFGRYVNSVGEEQWPAQLTLTPGATNSGPRLGPVVLSEIQYNPAPGFDEFVELRNLTAAPVALADPLRPTNTWRLNGADFAFPTGAVIQANSFALVVALDPAVFRAKYGVPAAVPVFGPFAGSLQNDGERLELQRPDAPGTNGVVPFITVDAVRYNDKLPWPVSADGDGPSLQRLVAGAYGDDPVNWFASGVTPGATNVFNAPPVVFLTAPLPGDAFIPPANITLTATATDSNGVIQLVEFFANGVKLGEATNAPFSIVWSNAPSGTHYLTAKARDNSFGVTTSEAVPVVVFSPAPVTLVPRGAVWRFLDTGVTPPAAWASTNFNDMPWFIGLAPLGYGDGDEATVVAFGPNGSSKYITTWFRRSFTITNATRYLGLNVSVLRDGGAVVWLNGVEVFRSNMPGGTITPGTLASSSVSGPDESTVFYGTNVPSALLVEGTNVLAVEIHQDAPDSSDISFDCELTGLIAPPAPGVMLISPAPGAVFAAPARVTIIANAEASIGRITRVEFFAGPVKVGESTNSPLASVTWSNAALGSYSLTAVARSDAGIIRTSPPVAISVVANVPPSVTLFSPTNGQFIALGVNLPITASAATQFGSVTEVSFLLDGVELGRATNAPFTITWANTTFGPHTLRAIASNDGGLSATSAPVSVNVVSNLAPLVALTSPLNLAVLNVPTNVNTNFTLAASANDADGAVAKVEFYDGVVKLGEAQTEPYTLVWANPATGLHRLTAVATDTSFARGTSAVVAVVVTRFTPTTVTLINTGAVWRYLDNGTDQGTNWSQLAFNDPGWSNGVAELGYGEASEGRPEATVVGFGPNAAIKYITTYFRRAFVVTNSAGFTDLTASLLRDDGAVVWLNGVEAYRSNMPGGSVNYLSVASGFISGTDETLFVTNALSPALLREGTNILAVEIHQGSADSSDISFDFALRGARLPATDSDGDGLPDVWEYLNGLNPSVNDAALDSDGDSVTNLQEYLAGTDPRDASSYLRIFIATGTPVQLEFLALSNRTYSLQSRAPLVSGLWSNFASYTAVPTNRVIHLPAPASPGSQQFFRLSTPATP